MDQEPIQNPPEEPKQTGNAGMSILWFLLGFFPSVVSIPFVGKNSSEFPIQGLLVLAIICCLFSGFGVARGVKNLAARVLLGLFLAGTFFVMNTFIVILVGCSKMGPI